MILFSNINKLTFIIAIICAIGLTSCSKKVTYPAPTSLSQEYISNLSSEKQMAYNFVTASKNDNSLIDSLLSENFISHDQNWMGKKEFFINN